MRFFNTAFCFSFLFFTHLILSHGFADHTLICNQKNSWWALDQVSILHERNERPAVLSYDYAANRWRSRGVTGVASAVSNCYLCISFDDRGFNDIMCTPSQAFYLPKNRKWIPAYQLKEGDLLLAKDNKRVAVTRIKFIQKTLPVLSIEVADTHTFCVGKYGVVTHNMFVPDIAMNTIPIFSAAGVGASVGILSNPVTATIVGGVIACGVIGYIVKSYVSNRVVQYDLNYNAEKIRMYRNGGNDSFDSEGEVPSGVVLGGTPDPEDSDKENKEKILNSKKIELSKDDIKHIFKDEPGHLADTPQNRQLLIDVASDEKNFLCIDQWGTRWYGKLTPEGKQLWATVRDRVIRNGGMNDIPITVNPETGLAAPFKPKGKLWHR